jgi:GNAT superfamily N-acetyltransferase
MSSFLTLPTVGLKNTDPQGDAILHIAVLRLLDDLRTAVAKDSPYPWRGYRNNRFASLYVRVTFRVVQAKGMKAPRRVRTVELASIDVLEQYRGRGTFRAVLAELKSIAKSSGRTLYLENVINEDLYRSMRKDPDMRQLRQIDGPSDNCFVYFPK